MNDKKLPPDVQKIWRRWQYNMGTTSPDDLSRAWGWFISLYQKGLDGKDSFRITKGGGMGLDADEREVVEAGNRHRR